MLMNIIEANNTEEVQEDTQNTENETQEEQETETQETQSDTDYDAELTKIREKKAQLEQERKELADLAFKKRQTQKQVDEDEDDDSPAPLTAEALQKLLDERDAKFEKRQQEGRAREIAQKLATNGGDSEAELIYEVYNTRINPTGNLQEDMELAYLIANRKRFFAETQEAKRALSSKENRSKASGDAGNKRTEHARPELPPHAESAIKMAKMRWNSNKGRFENPTRWLAIDKNGSVTSGAVEKK